MHNEFTAIIEQDGAWHIAYCLEIPGANGQGHTPDDARESLAEAIGGRLQANVRPGSAYHLIAPTADLPSRSCCASHPQPTKPHTSLRDDGAVELFAAARARTW